MHVMTGDKKIARIRTHAVEVREIGRVIAVGRNMVFERFGKLKREEITSGRHKKK